MHLLSDNTALRSYLESQANFMHAFFQKALDTLSQVSEMNLELARQEIEGTLYASRDIMACSDPMQMAQAAMRQIPPAAERLRSYQQHLMAVLSAGSAIAVADEALRRAAAVAPVNDAAVPGKVIVSSSSSSSSSNASAAGETHH